MYDGLQLTVRYQETDQMGIVHHSVYPIWYEAARTDFIKHFGISYGKMEEMGLLLPVYEVTSKYLSPAIYEDQVTIKVSIREITCARILFYYEVFKNPNENPINTGTTLHAFTGKNLKPINIKKAFPEIYKILTN